MAGTFPWIKQSNLQGECAPFLFNIFGGDPHVDTLIIGLCQICLNIDQKFGEGNI